MGLVASDAAFGEINVRGGVITWLFSSFTSPYSRDLS